MKSKEISQHEIIVWRSLSQSWKTSKEVARETGVSDRTARNHLRRFVAIGIAEVFVVFRGYRYREPTYLTIHAKDYINKLVSASNVLGFDKKETA